MFGEGALVDTHGLECLRLVSIASLPPHSQGPEATARRHRAGGGRLEWGKARWREGERGATTHLAATLQRHRVPQQRIQQPQPAAGGGGNDAVKTRSRVYQAQQHAAAAADDAGCAHYPPRNMQDSTRILQLEREDDTAPWPRSPSGPGPAAPGWSNPACRHTHGATERPTKSYRANRWQAPMRAGAHYSASAGVYCRRAVPASLKRSVPLPPLPPPPPPPGGSTHPWARASALGDDTSTSNGSARHPATLVKQERCSGLFPSPISTEEVL